jgi:thiol-disulfide isomerase/thioredoxin
MQKYFLSLLSLFLFLPLYLNSEESITINDINLGELLWGDEITAKDLQGNVVAVEFWMINCPQCPCGCDSRQPLLHLTKWYKKFASKGLVILAFHNGCEESKEEVIAFAKKSRVKFSLYRESGISGLSISELPTLVLFNHKGESIYNGDTKKAEFVLSEAINSIPDPLIGEFPYKKLTSLVEKIRNRKEVGQILSILKTKYLKSSDPDERLEAENLVKCLSEFAMRAIQKADKKRNTEPYFSYNLYQEIFSLFKGDKIVDNLQKTLTELNKDKNFQDTMNCDKLLLDLIAEVERARHCNKCPMFNKDCRDCHKAFVPYSGLDLLILRAKGLVKRYPFLCSAEEVVILLLD